MKKGLSVLLAIIMALSISKTTIAVSDTINLGEKKTVILNEDDEP